LSIRISLPLPSGPANKLPNTSTLEDFVSNITKNNQQLLSKKATNKQPQ
jgi:hypothetical protein